MVYYKRSPFLVTYWDENNKLVIYNYNQYSKAAVSEDTFRLLNTLSKTMSDEEIAEQLGTKKAKLRITLQHLVGLKFIHEDKLSNEDLVPKGIEWNLIDLAMQRQRSYGGRAPMSKRVGKSPSPVKKVNGLSSTVLPKITIRDYGKDTLVETLEERRSIREYSKNCMNVKSLSRFLYRSARIKKIWQSKEGILTKRPYPSGGARYPLEIYVLNNKVNGIVKGIHYYDPLKHKLVLVNQNKNYQKKFNAFLWGVQKPLMNREPDVVLIITAVFARTMWKYRNLGISLIMSDLGCLYQTMYLVATEMNLAPCPIGKIDEELVRKWLSLNWFEESHIGTFMLGIPKHNNK